MLHGPGVPGCLFFGWIVDRFDRRRNGEILAVSLAVLLGTTPTMLP